MPKAVCDVLALASHRAFPRLPEVGDIDKPKIALFFDEAHLLYSPRRRRRSSPGLSGSCVSSGPRGVGVFFVTQSAAEVPATAAAFRVKRGVDLKGELTALGVGEAFGSVLDDPGVPTKVGG
jgi:DNA helicase HerA-like ATPase